MDGAAKHSLARATDATPTAPAPAADGERILLLECRLEQLRSALDDARADADFVRAKLADAAAREADHARRYSLVHQELAETRAEITSLHERLSRSEALRAELEGHLFEAGARGDAAELVRLRREVVAQRQRSLISEQTCSRLRARVDKLLASRETLLTRVAEWQRLVRIEGPTAVDLAEFIAELRGDILHLEDQNAAGERQEAALRERLVRAGLDMDEPPGEDLPDEPVDVATDAERGDPHPARTTAPLEAEEAEAAESVAAAHAAAAGGSDAADLFAPAPAVVAGQPEAADLFDEAIAITTADGTPVDALVAASPVSAGRDEVADSIELVHAHDPEEAGPVYTGAEATTIGAKDSSVPPAPEREEPIGAAYVPPVEGLDAADPAARAAAYEQLTRALEGEPTRLAEQLRSGLADPHPRVRRRAVLAAATARRLALHPLLDPLRGDPDPQVRRVVREVLRNALPALRPDDREETVLAPARVPARVPLNTRS